MAQTPESGQVQELRIGVEDADGRSLVRLEGELDLASLPALNAALNPLVATAHSIVIDVEKVTFIDSSGLRDLLAWRRRSHEENIDFTVTPGTPHVRRLFGVTGLLDRPQSLLRPGIVAKVLTAKSPQPVR